MIQVLPFSENLYHPSPMYQRGMSQWNLVVDPTRSVADCAAVVSGPAPGDATPATATIACWIVTYRASMKTDGSISMSTIGWRCCNTRACRNSYTRCCACINAGSRGHRSHTDDHDQSQQGKQHKMANSLFYQRTTHPISLS